MDVGDIATVAVAGMLLAALSAAILTQRRRRRSLLGLLHSETLGLCREAAELAEAICRRQADGGVIDQAFLDRYALTEPQTWPGLVPSLWRLPPVLAGRAVEFHGHLCLARTRLAGWRSGEQDRVSTYLLLSALTRTANGGDSLLRESALRPGQRTRWALPMPLAAARISEMEHDDLEFLDWGYWSILA